MSGDATTYVQIEPTTRCNFTCGFCCGRHMPQEDLSYDTFLQALETFPDMEHVELQGEGESLLHKRFFDMVDALRARDIKVSFITNGSLLSPTAVDRLLAVGIDKISVSIESSDPAVFRDIRGGKLEKVERNLAHLMEEKRTRNLVGPVVGLSITVLERTRDAFAGILALYDRLGLDGGITLQPLQRMESYAQHYDADMEAQYLDDKTVQKLWMAFFSDANVRRVQANKGPIPGFYDEMMEGWRPALGTCPYLDKGLYVHRDGNVTPCCMVKQTDKYGLGKLGVDSREQIVQRRKVYRDQLKRGTIPAPCDGCELAKFAVMSRWNLMRFGMKGLYNRLLTPPGFGAPNA